MAPLLLIAGGLVLVCVGLFITMSAMQQQPIVGMPVGTTGSAIVFFGGRAFVLGVLLLIARDDWATARLGSVRVDRRGPPPDAQGDFEQAA